MLWRFRFREVCNFTSFITLRESDAVTEDSSSGAFDTLAHVRDV